MEVKQCNRLKDVSLQHSLQHSHLCNAEEATTKTTDTLTKVVTKAATTTTTTATTKFTTTTMAPIERCLAPALSPAQC